MKKRNVIRKAAVLLTTFVFVLSIICPSVRTEAATASKVISRVYTSEKVVALTFDDGDDGANIPAILKILSDNNVKATFFLKGKSAMAHPQQIKNIVAKGHAIGNHSYSHPYFTKITATQMKTELYKTETYIRTLTGVTTKPYFRPPYGAYNTSVLQTVGSLGYTKTITWTIDTIDWDGRSASRITSKVMNNIVPGAIVLMHTGSGAPNTPAALPTIIKSLKAKGYRFVTIPKLLSISTSSVTYVAKAGDTLTGIAQKYGVTVQQIATANNITNTNLIYVGQVLIIPVKTTYTVKSGDTLSAIALLYGVTVQQIAAANNITNINLINVGQILVIP